MKGVARLCSWLRASFQRARMETQMNDEIRFHIERYTEDLIRNGLSPDEARQRARAEFGGIVARKDECRDALGLRLLDELRSDCRYTSRLLRQSPTFTIVAILSLALGIGANTAIFTLMEAVLWKTIPVRYPEQLRLLTWTSGPRNVMDSTWGQRKRSPTGAFHSTAFSYAVFREMEHKTADSQTVFAFKPSGRMVAVIDGHAELVDSELVSGNFYDSSGVVPVAGRPVAPADDVRNPAEVVAVISDGFWSRRFGRDASALGKHISLNQVPVTIVGINPPDFHGMEPGQNPDVFLPLSPQPAVLPNQWTTNNNAGSLLDDPDTWWLQIMLRLKPGVSEQMVEAALDVTLARTVRESLPNKKNYDMPRIRLQSGSRGLDELREQFRKPVFVLLTLVGLVLLIASANVANLLLARATARQREISTRLALGAGRWRIIRQMLTEGLILALLGGGAGLVLGFWTRNGIPGLLATSWTPSPVQAQFDFQVLLISIGVTVLTGILFSLAPAWRSTRIPLNATLKDGARSTMSLPNLLAGKSLIVFQICLSLLLLVGAGLFVRTLANLKAAGLGFRPERILLFTLDPPRTRYAGEKRTALFLQLEERIQGIPGIQSATLSQDALVADNTATTSFTTPGRGPRPGEADWAWINQVGDRFFETMGIPILYSRSIGVQDRINTPLVGVVNQQFVRNFFPGENPLGKTVVNGNHTYQIVGICGDAHFEDVRSAAPPTFYGPFTQAHDIRNMTFELKTAASEGSVLKSVREVVRSVDKDLPVFDIRTQTEQIDATLSNERLFAALASGFGLLALVLATVGIYGVMAYAVARRTGEIGVRMALGAQKGQVLRMILRETTLLATVGITIGTLASVALTRYIRGMLYGLTPSDPLALGGAVLLLLLVVLAAGWWPARRASRLDPMVALRHE
jgi:predicted permease